MKTKKRKQWLLAVILATILIFPAAVRTEAVQWNVYYNLAVGDRKVSAWNADDILGDGTVSYDAAEHTLYLKNAHIRGFTGVKYGEALEETDRPFTIVSSGNCTIETYDCGTAPSNITAYAIRSDNFAAGPDLNIRGSGTLNLFATNSNGWEEGIAIGGNLTVTGSLTVNIKLGRTTDDVPADPAEAPAASEKEEEILKRKADEAPKGSAFNLLQLRFSKVTRTSIQLKWTKVPGVAGYTLYGNRCGKVYKKLKSFSASRSSWTQKTLQKGKYYKYYIVATAKYGGVKKVIASSKTIHVATSGENVGNYKSVKLKNVKNNTVSIKKGKSFTIKASAVAVSSKLKVKQHRKLAYESTNPAVAKVSSKGIIKAVEKGTCYVYVYTQSGTFKRIKVKVK